jgi:hypothetical protein
VTTLTTCKGMQKNYCGLMMLTLTNHAGGSGVEVIIRMHG